MSIFDKAWKKVKDTAGAASGAAGDVVDTLTGAGSDAVGAATDVAGDAVDAVAGEVERVLRALLDELAAGVLGRVLAVLDVAVPSHLDIAVGPVEFHIGSVDDRIDDIRRVAESPPTDLAGVRAVIEALAPEAVSVNLSAELALLVVSSDSLKIGAKLTYDKDDFLAKIERVWETFS